MERGRRYQSKTWVHLVLFPPRLFIIFKRFFFAGWAFLFLLCVLLVSIVIALIELAADVWGKKETSAVKKGEKKPAVHLISI